MFTLSVVASVSVVAGYLAMCAASPSRPLSERLLLSALGLTLGIQTEAMALSALPIHQPLRLWPAIHLTTCGVVAAVAARRLGRAGTGEAFAQLLRWPRLVHARSGWLGDAVMVGLTMTLLGTALWGLFSAPNGVDELGYHVPQAAEIYQNRSVGRPANFLPWTYAYPQGAAVLWAWTIFFVHGDGGIHLVQAGFGLQVVLATYVLARRTGATLNLGLAAALAVATAPVFFRMSTIATADMCFTAGTLTMVAFLAPGIDSRRGGDCRLALLGFAQACAAKIPFVALALGLPAAGWLVVQNGTRLRRAWTSKRRPRPRLRWFDVAVLVVLAGSLSTYAVNLVQYENPFWPLQISAAGHAFPGPLRAFTDHTIGAHTTWGRPATLNRAQLWAASFFNWSQPLDEDSLGAFGPDIALLGLAGAGFAIWKAARRQATWLLTVAGACALAIAFVPVLFIPRYGLPVVAVVVALGASAWTGRAAHVVTAATLVLCAYSSAPSFRFATDGARWYAANAQHQAWWQDRGHSVADNHRLNDPRTAQSPGLVRYVRTHVRDELVVWNVMAYPTLMWNLDFSNRIQFLPGSPREAYPTGPSRDLVPAPQDLTRWLTRLNQLGPKYVVVYEGSSYETALLSSGRWDRDYTDPQTDGADAVSVLRPTVALPIGPRLHRPATPRTLH